MDDGAVRKSLLSAVLLLLLTTIPVHKNTFRGDLHRILDGLLKQEHDHHHQQGNRFPRVAVGFGSCLDVIALDGVTVLGRAGISPPVFPRHHDKLSSADDVAEAFAYFFQHGAAAELVKW